MTEGGIPEGEGESDSFDLVRGPKTDVNIGDTSVEKLQKAAARGVQVDITFHDPGSADVKLGDEGFEATQTRPGKIKADVTKVAVQGVPTRRGGLAGWLDRLRGRG